ncbi:MAG: hypothetical protein ABFD91_02765 [Anaerohalosphaeraceae bacterium]
MTSPAKPIIKPAFLACAVVLAFFAATKAIVIHRLGVQLTKFPIPLKKSLDQLDAKKLEPYLVRGREKISNLDVLESLGTEQYLNWTLEDPREQNDSPTRYLTLFITYYTGNPDMVPHVPDECYAGSGNTKLKAGTVSIDISWPGQEKPLPISMQSVLFSRQEKNSVTPESTFSVQYCFKANGEFCGSRTETRTLLGQNFFVKYSYFAKIEWKFYGTDFTGPIYPNEEQTLEASKKLLSTLLPVLEQDHWPDWEKAKRGEIIE